MKGVILGIAPTARLVDLSHEVAPYRFDQAAFLVAQALPHFPADTVHLIVVDPGVGTARRALVAHGRTARFVGPDNGVLGPLLALDGPATVHAIATPDFLPKARSATFHGRDVFAPAAAHVGLGRPLADFGPAVPEDLARPFPKPEETPDGWRGQVLHIDRFGNLITNLPNALAAALEGVEIAGRRLALCGGYSDVARGEAGAVPGSVDRIEVFVREGSARDFFGAAVGMPVLGSKRA